MSDTLTASIEGLIRIDRARKEKGWTKTKTPTWWDLAHTSQETLRQFWQRIPIAEEDFIKICQVVGVNNWQQIATNISTDFNLLSKINIPVDIQGKRTLAAIVFTDTVSFSKRMSENEEHTLNLVQRDLQLMTDICDQFEGQVLKSTGDGLLMYFTSAIQAVGCATEIQKLMANMATQFTENDILEHRIGIHLGDVFFSEKDVMGNGVNIAARLQTQAEPGGICISQTVYDVVKNYLEFQVNYLGKRELKNIADTVPIYQILIASQKARQQSNLVNYQTATNLKQDWGEAPDITSFYGRIKELNLLETWVIEEQCKLIAILGMGGIGKTSLAITLADQIQEKFDFIIWRSLVTAPLLIDLLADLIRVISQGKEHLATEQIQPAINHLIHLLQQKHCLLILDEIEGIFSDRKDSSRHRPRQYQPGYENYGQLFKKLGSDRHQSCLIITSREKPEEIATNEAENSKIKSLDLRGLPHQDAQLLFEIKGFSGKEQGLKELIDLYGGNPLALKVITTMIQEIFNNNVNEFLKQNTIILGDRLRTLLQQQINRLSDLEQEILYWLMIEHQPISVAKLQENLLFPPVTSILLETLIKLERKSLLDKITQGDTIQFSLQPLVIKYLTEEFIEQSLDEIDQVLETQNLQYFKTLKNHIIRQSSEANNIIIYDPKLLLRLKDGLQTMFRTDNQTIANELSQILPLLQGRAALNIGYLGNNFRLIFEALEVDINAYNWQDIALINRL